MKPNDFPNLPARSGVTGLPPVASIPATEWESERASWSSNNTAGALASPLKLAAAGYRDNSSGGLTLIESRGYYWSSTVSSAVSGTRSSNLYFRSDTAATDTGIGLYRACGLSVRCIKD